MVFVMPRSSRAQEELRAQQPAPSFFPHSRLSLWSLPQTRFAEEAFMQMREIRILGQDLKP